jgi:hypothetical protein
MGEHLVFEYYNNKILENNNHVHLNIKCFFVNDLY